MLTSRSFTGILGKDIEKKNVKTQKVKLIHKMSQRPEISRRYVWFPEDLEDTPFTIKMALLSLKQLLRGILVIAALPLPYNWCRLL